MNSKLTLSIKTGAVKKAKKYAAENDTSVSAVFEDFIEYVTVHSIKKNGKQKPKNPLLSRLFSNIRKANQKLPPNKKFDYKKELSNSLMKKYNIKHEGIS